jgi:EmrB/QacA subfamily drug resistance transporter
MTHSPLRPDPPSATWILVASILGSGAAFLETSVVVVALPAIGHSMGLGVAGLEAVTNGYLLTLSALMLLGGALGDRYGESRIFAVGLAGFAAACGGCAAAPSATILILCRVLQGVCGALLVPNSLAMVETTFSGEARGTAIGRWSAWSAVTTAVGPLVGGWIVDQWSWRWVFALMIPFALAAAVIVVRHRPLGVLGSETGRRGSLDYGGALLITLALASLVGSLTLATTRGLADFTVIVTGASGVILLAICAVVEARSSQPLLPAKVFRSPIFTGANAVTLLVYAALGGLLFLLMLELQGAMGYTALAAGASLLPANVLMLLLSPAAGRLAERIGPRPLIVAGSAILAAGMALFTRLGEGASFVGSVLPATVVLGLGLAVLVAPLTATVLGALGDEFAGLASGVNNAVARLGSLLATAALPLAAGIHGTATAQMHAFSVGFTRAMWISAATCLVGAAVGWLTLPGGLNRPGERRTFAS